MEINLKLLPCIPILISLVFISGGLGFAQEKTNISAGAGFTETLNLGVRFQVPNQSQIGVSIGSWPAPEENWLIDWESWLSLSGDYYYHFGDTTRFSVLFPWYIRTGVVYIRIVDEEFKDNNLEYHLRTGRDIYFSRNVGISLDAGIALFVINESGFTTLLPAFGIGLFARF